MYKMYVRLRVWCPYTQTWGYSPEAIRVGDYHELNACADRMGKFESGTMALVLGPNDSYYTWNGDDFYREP